MREIKFRGWNQTFNEMCVSSFGGHYISFGGKVYNGSTVSDIILMQYTGFKDKNGKEIYEDYIVKYGMFALNDIDKYGEKGWESLPDGVDENDISTIITIEQIKFTPQGLMRLDFMVNNNPDVTGVEIIGNICETPELLPEPTQ